MSDVYFQHIPNALDNIFKEATFLLAILEYNNLDVSGKL